MPLAGLRAGRFGVKPIFLSSGKGPPEWAGGHDRRGFNPGEADEYRD